MPTFSYPISASLGSSKSGLIPNVGFRVISADDVVRIPRTTSGVEEILDSFGNATTGIYKAVITLNSDWGLVRIIWDVDDLDGVVAEEVVNTAAPSNLSSYNYQQPLVVSFGSAFSGLETFVSYQVISADGTIRISRTNSGVIERTDWDGAENTGVYEVTATFNRSWGAVLVVWDITDTENVAAVETILASSVRPKPIDSAAAPGAIWANPYATNVLGNFYSAWDQLCAEVDFMKASLDDPNLTDNQKNYFVQMYSPRIENVKNMFVKSFKILQDTNPQIPLSKDQELS
jgi:hypothetical protein